MRGIAHRACQTDPRRPAPRIFSRAEACVIEFLRTTGVHKNPILTVAAPSQMGPQSLSGRFRPFASGSHGRIFASFSGPIRPQTLSSPRLLQLFAHLYCFRDRIASRRDLAKAPDLDRDAIWKSR